MSCRPHIILGITGSVAAVKGPQLALRLSRELKAHVKIILTRTVEQHFWKEGRAVSSYDENGWRELHHKLSEGEEGMQSGDGDGGGGGEDWRLSHGRIDVHYAEEEWKNYNSLQDSVLHIDLRNWADLCLVAPLSAHTLAKISNGMCDDLLTCCLRAWDFGQRKQQSLAGESNGSGGGSEEIGVVRGKPVILAPAMNTAMWDHPLTKVQLEMIRGFCSDNDHHTTNNSNGITDTKVSNCVLIVQPAVKKLACGDVGAGALADLNDIIVTVKECLVKWKISDYEVAQENGGSDVEILPEQSLHDSGSSSGRTLTSSKRTAMKKALILAAKRRFLEMQTIHQQERHVQALSLADGHTPLSQNQLPQPEHSAQNAQSSKSSPLHLLAAPISPTPNNIIQTFLPQLDLNSNSLLVDLGCGDGRWLIAAARMTNCSCLGIDVDEERLDIATKNIEEKGLCERSQVQVRKQDIFEFVASDEDMFLKADVFVLYLFREAMVKMNELFRQRLLKGRSDECGKGLKGGKEVRILCIGFALGGWTPAYERKVDGLRVYLYKTANNKK